MVRFDYLKPSTVKEAIDLLYQHGPEATVIAGGTDVMVAIKQRKIVPKVLISLRHISGLDYITCEGGEARIGSMTTHRTLEASPLVRQHFGALADAVGWLGSVQIRNVATVGGNICNAAPSADTAAPLLVLDCKVGLIGREGERIVPLDEFFVGPGKTVMRSDEIVKEFVMPVPSEGVASAYWKLTRRKAMDLPILGVAMSLSVESETMRDMEETLKGGATAGAVLDALERGHVTCREARIGLGVAAPTPMLAREAATVLSNVRLTRTTIDEAGRIASEEARPRDSVRGKAWYRRELIRVLTGRLAVTCLQRISARGTL